MARTTRTTSRSSFTARVLPQCSTSKPHPPRMVLASRPRVLASWVAWQELPQALPTSPMSKISRQLNKQLLENRASWNPSWTYFVSQSNKLRTFRWLNYGSIASKDSLSTSLSYLKSRCQLKHSVPRVMPSNCHRFSANLQRLWHSLSLSSSTK